MAEPRVSVVMPVRNGGRHLKAAVESILTQTIGELELIFVDDGSDDGTPAELQRYAERDSRVRVLSQPPLGLAAASNTGWQAARAPIVARMDADDVALPERLARQLEALEAQPELALVGSAVTVIDEDGRRLTSISYPQLPHEIRERLAVGNPLAHPTVMMRREALEHVGGYRASFAYAEDYDLWLRLSERYELSNLAEELLCYRLHPRQVTGSDFEQQVVSIVVAKELARLRRSGAEEPALPERIDRAFVAALGVSDGELALEAARTAATWSDFLFAAGRREEAAAGIQAARAVARTPRALGLLDRRQAREAFRMGRRGEAVRALVRSARRDPSGLVRALLARGRHP
jgi:hypothetical protein